MESCGVGDGGGKGFHTEVAFFGKGLPNQPVFWPVIGSVDGSQPFEANTPSVIRNTAAAIPPILRYLLRFVTRTVFMDDIRILLDE
ncbi:MAG: hypothetical protein JNJ39_08800 [Blastocatellia bacterium]|nr:hypothetical protein [Blastocatellia bacterium]